MGVGVLLVGVASCGCASCGGGDTTQEAAPVTVAVAANFADAARALGARFTREEGRDVRVVVGSTGELYAQIEHGAPFDVFLAADQERPRRLEAEGLTVPGSRATYAVGRLVLYGPDLPGVRGPADLEAGTWRHLAVANPRTAPYGAAAMETLARLGLAEAVAPRLVQGESVGQTYQFVRSGAAELGFVALSQVVEEPGRTYWVVPDSFHAPIRQDRVLLARASDESAARAFLAFLDGPAGREVVRAYGYAVPEEGG